MMRAAVGYPLLRGCGFLVFTVFSSGVGCWCGGVSWWGFGDGGAGPGFVVRGFVTC